MTASAGPWPIGQAGIQFNGATAGKGGTFFFDQAGISGRADPNGPVDRIAMARGRWWQNAGEVVLEDAPGFDGISIGDTITLQQAPPEGKTAGPPVPQRRERQRQRERIRAGSCDPHADRRGLHERLDQHARRRAWMSPQDVTALAPTGSTPDLQMLYRVAPSATADDLAKAASLITAGVPAADLHGTTPFLAQQENVNRLANLMVPILLAFSAFALLAAAFAIVNV